MTSINQAMDEVCPRIDQAMKEVEAVSATTLSDQKRAVADKILDDLQNTNLAYKAVFKVEEVAPHPDNRSGAGVDPEDTQGLVLTIASDGF